MSPRECADCGAREGEAAFPGDRKPRKLPDRCCDCIADPGGVGFAARCVARKNAIQALRRSGRFVRVKPVHTMPLFATLRRPGTAA